jgi:putative tryptophan/tyrosine transport system substrate-binding protein
MERRRSRLTRRRFMVGAAGLGLLAGCGRWPWQAQPTRAEVPRLGYLSGNPPPPGGFVETLQGFLQGIQDLGYTDGQNIAIEYRWADGDETRLPALAAELVQLNVDIILAGGLSAALAARDATSTVPIVLGASNDPIGAGLVTSLARPAGNVTGVSLLSSRLSAKRLELLRDAVPSLTRVAVLAYTGQATMEQDWGEMQIAAQALRLHLHRLDVGRPDGLAGAFETAARQDADGLIALPSQFLTRARTEIVDLAAKIRLPALYEHRAYVEAGGLMAYGANVADAYRRAAYYVDRLLKGAKPADLPIEQSMRFDLVINMKTARELGITFPNEILLQVTEVIQ